MVQKNIYLEIRLECESEEEKRELASKFLKQAKLLGVGNRAAYVRSIVEIDAATGILKKLNENK